MVQGRFWWLASVQLAQGCTWQQKSCTLQKVAFCTRLSFEENCILPIIVALFCFALSGSITTVLVHFALCTLYLRISVCMCVEGFASEWKRKIQCGGQSRQSTWWIWGPQRPLPGTDSSKAEAKKCYVPTLCPPNPPKARLLQIIVKLQLHSALLLCH